MTSPILGLKPPNVKVSDGSQRPMAILPAPLEDLVRIHIVRASHPRNRSSRLERFLNDLSSLLLRSKSFRSIFLPVCYCIGRMTTDRWNIEAKAPEGITSLGVSDPNTLPPQALMLQSLLEDRFQLKVHRDTREMPVNELRFAKGGAKLKLSEDQGPIQPVAGLPQRGQPMPRGTMRMGRGDLDGTAVLLPNLISALSQQLGRTVIDRTGLYGRYDIKLVWTPNLATTGTPPAPRPREMMEAAQQTLQDPPFLSGYGTAWASAGICERPVEVIVIDSVQRPSEN
jgi:uncharacterized protein (TIGR03435 family)